MALDSSILSQAMPVAELGLPAPPKRYRIGELAQFTGLTRQTLHNYTRWGLIRESSWSAGGHRLYDETVFIRLAWIMRLKPTHSIDQIRQTLQRHLSGNCP